MKTQHMATAVLALACIAPTARGQVPQPVPNVPGVPPISTASQTQFQQQTHFLTFLGSFIPESAASAKAYYTAIDPNNTKPTFTKWLVNAGFIANEGQWHPSGAQTIVVGQPAGVYGDNIINTDSHVIVLNASDLGFVRNQFIRCRPSCSAPNPIIYTYLENYPVNPFAASGNGGSGFPIKTGYPAQAEAAAAINSAVNRPLGDLPGCKSANTDTRSDAASSELPTLLLNGRLPRMALRRRRGSGNSTPMSSSGIKTPG